MRNREKKTCEWAWRMGLLKLRRSRGSPSHSASLWERSRARPARPPAPWTSEQVGARRPRPRPPPPPSGSEIRFPSFSPPPEPHAGARPGSRARAGEVRPGALERGRVGTRHSWSPLGGAGRWPRARRGAWTTRRPGQAATWSPSEAGSQRTRGHRAPCRSRGKRLRGGQRGCGGGVGGTGRGAREEGARRGRGREAEGEPAAEQREARGGRHLGPRRTPSSAGGEGRRARERRAEGRASLAGLGGRAAGLPAPTLRAAWPEPSMLPTAAEPAAGRGGAAGRPGPRARGGLGVITAGGG